MNIWDLVVRLRGDGQNLRDDIEKDKAKLGELNADIDKLHGKDVKVDIQTTDARTQVAAIKRDIDQIKHTNLSFFVQDKEADDKLYELHTQIEALEGKVLKINLDDKNAVEKIRALSLDTDDLRAKLAAVPVHVLDGNAKEKVTTMKALVDSLHDKVINIKVDDSQAERKLDELKAKEGNGRGGGILGPLISSLLPAASPLGAGIVGGGMGLLSGATPAAAGGAGFGAIATTTLTPVFQALSQLKQAQQQYQQLLNNPTATNAQKLAALAQERQATANLNAEQLKALHSAQEFGNWWKGWSSQFQGSVVSTFTNFLNLIKQGMSGLGPSIKGFASGFTQLEQEASKALGGAFWKSFFSWLGQNAKQSTLDFGHAIGNLVTGFAALLKAFDPLAKSMDTGLVNMTKRFADWAKELPKSKGFQQFLDYVKQTGPQVLKLISQLVQIIVQLLTDMGPMGASLLQLANGLAGLLNSLLKINPLIGAFAAFALQSWGISKLLGPFGSMGKSVSGFIPTIEKLAGKAGLVGLFGKGLMGLIPVFKAVGNGMSFIGGPWGLLVAAILAAVLLVITHWDTIKKWWSDFVGWISRLWNNTLRPFFNKWGPEILAVLAPFIGIPLVIHQHWNQISKWFSDLWSTVKKFLVKWGPDILAILAPFIGVPLIIKQHWGQITKFFTDLWSGKKGIKSILDGWVTDALNFGSNIVNNIVTGIVTAIDSAETKVKQALGKLGSWLGLGGGSSGSPTSQLSVSPGVASMVGGGTVSGTITVQHTGSVTVGGLTPKAVQQVNQSLYNTTIRR